MSLGVLATVLPGMVGSIVAGTIASDVGSMVAGTIASVVAGDHGCHNGRGHWRAWQRAVRSRYYHQQQHQVATYLPMYLSNARYAHKVAKLWDVIGAYPQE